MDLDYSLHPEKFFKLDPNEQSVILISRFGPVEDFVYKCLRWPDSMTDPIEEYKRNHSLVISRISIHLGNGNWTMAGMIMMFFDIGHYGFSQLRSNTPESFMEFAQVFPFGCFSHVLPLNNNLTINNSTPITMQWCYGCSLKELIAKSLYFGETFFQCVLEGIETRDYSGHDTLYVFEEMVFFWKYGAEEKPHYREELHKRIRTIIDLFCQKKLLPTIEQTDIIVYPCLIPYHYWQVEELEFRDASGFPFMIRRPKWTREKHRYLSMDLKFRRRVRTTLMMQKYRYACFPLHRDLINLVLEYLFAAELDSLEHEMRHQQNRMKEFLKKSYDEQRAFCMSQGIATEIHQDSKGDALELADGKTICSARIKRYNSTMAELLLGCDHLREFISMLKSQPVSELIESEKIGHYLLDYCRSMNYDLNDVLNGTKILDGDDLYAIVKTFDHVYVIEGDRVVKGSSGSAYSI